MMIKGLLLHILILFHPVHVSLTTINQSPGSDTLTVSFRMYYDDFQLDYKLFYPDLDPDKNNDPSDYSNEMLSRYYFDRVSIHVNNKLLKGRITSVTINHYEILMSFEYLSVKKPTSIKIRNQILTAIYNDQANFAYININNYEAAAKMTADDTEEIVKLK